MERYLASAVTVIRRLLDAVLIALILVVLSGVILGKLVPLTGRETLVISGRSMEPTIPLGSAVVIAPVDARSLAVGDIVSLKAGPQNSLFTHRIVAVVDRPDGRWVQTKGDANAAQDPTLVPATAIVGRTQAVIPLAGYLIALLSIPTGVLFLIGLAATLMAGAWLLESVEPQPLDVRSDGPGTGSRRVPGEPIAARRLAPRRVDEPVRSFARPTIPVQLARSRETRARRERWTLNALRRDHRPRA